MGRHLEIKLKRKVVFQESSEQLYDAFAMQFATIKEMTKHQGDVDCDVDKWTDSEAGDIPIESMKALIQKAEDAGANFIQIDWHCDHEEYDVYGSKITRVDEEGLKRIAEKEATRLDLVRLNEIKTLKKRLEKLEK
jgi:hypothetical protein